ncbi:TPA: TolC family protein [Escherichia coli]|nr:TolC family protein [Escherichia coli]
MDEWFSKTDTFVSYTLEQEQNRTEEQNNISSLLPDISVGMGQYINNNKRLSTFGDSDVYLSLSQDMLSAYRYKNTKEKLAIRKSLQKLELQQKKYQYILNFYHDYIDYTDKKERVRLTEKKVRRLKDDDRKSEILLKAGKVSYLDTEIRQNSIDKMMSTLAEAELDKQYSLIKILNDYSVQEYFLDSFSYDKLRECKQSGLTALLRNITVKNKESVIIDNKISDSLLLPSLYVSFGLTPKNGGTLSDVSLRKMDYNASISMSLPLSNIFSAINSKKINSVNLEKNVIEQRVKYRQAELLRYEINDRLDIIKNKLSVLNKDLYIKKKEFAYISDRFRNKKESKIKFDSLQDDIYESELDIRKEENNRKYYELYLYFLD